MTSLFSLQCHMFISICILLILFPVYYFFHWEANSIVSLPDVNCCHHLVSVIVCIFFTIQSYISNFWSHSAIETLALLVLIGRSKIKHYWKIQVDFLIGWYLPNYVEFYFVGQKFMMATSLDYSLILKSMVGLIKRKILENTEPLIEKILELVELFFIIFNQVKKTDSWSWFLEH